MQYFFNFNITKISYEFTDTTLIYRNMSGPLRQQKMIRWDKIIGAGYHPMNKDIPNETGVLNQVMPPGFGKLMDVGFELNRISDMILLVYEASGKRRKMLYMHVKHNDPETSDMVADLQTRLGARWRTDPIADMNRYRREMGFSNWWVWLLVVAFLVIGGGLMIATMLGWDMIKAEWGLYIFLVGTGISGILLVWRWIKNRPVKKEKDIR